MSQNGLGCTRVDLGKLTLLTAFHLPPSSQLDNSLSKATAMSESNIANRGQAGKDGLSTVGDGTRGTSVHNMK